MRREFTTKTKALACAQCGKHYPQPYAQSRARLARPHYCSGACRDAAWSAEAERRLPGRLWARVAIGQEDQCWLWMGRRDPNGYGRLDTGGRPQLAHRISYELSTGKVTEGSFVCHSCDNPPCCNPNHLWLGNQTDNMADMSRKGRGNKNIGRHGDRHPCSKLTGAQALEVYRSNLSLDDMAKRFGVTPQALYLIKKGKNWRHVTGAPK